MSRRFNSIEKITLAATLLAIAIVLGTITKTIRIPHLSFLSFSFTPAIVIFSSLCLGPLYGALVGGLSDLIPAFLYPTGAYNFLLTIVFVLLGIFPWLLEKLTKRIRSFFPFGYLTCGLLAILFALECYFFYGTDLLNKRLSYFGEYAKVILLCLSALTDIICVVGLLLSERYYKRKKEGLSSLPGAGEVSFISFFLELILLVFLKGLAYYLYFIVISSTSYRVDYWLIVSMLVISAPLDLLFISLSVPWMLFFVNRYHASK
ncbi:MAG TPA: hypothetical protein DDW18_03285 [Firmicutes bacterium]|nr:hypothetical protein [Bacillota bacterium]